MPWIDGHLDLAYLAVNGRDVRQPCASADGCLSLPALRDAGVNLCLATIFTELGIDPAAQPHGYLGVDDLDAAERAGLEQLRVYERLEADGEIRIVRCGIDLSAERHNPRLVLLMEGADPIRSPERVHWWRERGLRVVGLTWAMGSRYAGGNATPAPLTPLGREMVRALDDEGMIHDVSHLADDAFDELMAIARGPVVATHSNCRALLNDSQRHLRNDQIAAIAARGGIVGLNLYTKFLAIGRRATIEDCVRHIEHVCIVMGHRRGVALGSDMDGGFGPRDLPIDLDHPSKLGALANALRTAGWNHADIEGFAHRNWARFLEAHVQ
jgi:membrane dipeptidase